MAQNVLFFGTMNFGIDHPTAGEKNRVMQLQVYFEHQRTGE